MSKRQIQHNPVIAFCIEELSVGGAENMLVVMANEFARRNWRVHMVCLSKAGEFASRLDESVELHVLNKKRGIDPALPIRMIRCIGTIKPDVINSHLWVANAWTRISLFAHSIPIVATEHSRDDWKPDFYRWVDRRLSRRTYKLVTVSEDTADFYRKKIRIKDHLITIIPNGVDTQSFAEGQGEILKQAWLGKSVEKPLDSAILIGTVGRLVPAKNHRRLVDAIAILRQEEAVKTIDIRVVIVGDGPERSNIQNYIDQNNLSDQIALVGPRHDIPDVLEALDIFVLSSDREGHPLTSLEAQAAGTPVVLTDAGGSGETIARSNGEAGGVLVAQDASAIATAIRQMVLDRKLLHRRGSFAREFALTNFDKNQMIEQYAKLFQAAVQAS
jgi:glycosyltransferase involved in cell wall biosynthesis